MKKILTLLLTICLLLISGCSSKNVGKSNSNSTQFDISKASYDDIYEQAVKLSHPLNGEIGLTNADLKYDKEGNLESFL